MKKISLLLLIVFLTLILFGWVVIREKWITEKRIGYTIFYTNSDKENINEYAIYFNNGKKSVSDFFQSTFYNEFDIYIHPNRISIDSSWQKDWNIPEFKSQCWMVASGIAIKLDIISPKIWDNVSCEHIYSNTIKTQQLITHELIHVFHGQRNISPDFSNVNGIDWFIEGLATYASGQCDSIRVSEVKNAILENKMPQHLNKFWTGNLKYGLSGTVVMYLDKKYGRKKMIQLLKHNNMKEVLLSLETTELEIISGWKEYMKEF